MAPLWRLTLVLGAILAGVVGTSRAVAGGPRVAQRSVGQARGVTRGARGVAGERRPGERVAIVVDRVTTAEGLAALEPVWRELAARAQPATPPTGFDWMATWWQVFGGEDGRALEVLVARDGARVIGIAPLLRRTVRDGGIPVHRLELVGSGEPEADEILSEYLDVIVERGREREAVAAFWARLAGDPTWDELCLASLPVSSPALAAWRAVAGPDPVDLETRARAPAIAVPLEADAAGFRARQGKKLREDLRRQRRLLEKHGPVVLEEADTPAGIARLWPDFVRLHQALWTSRGKPGCFASPRFTAFHEALSARLAARGPGHVHLAVLRVGGRAVAARYGFPLGATWFEYQSGLDPDFDPRVSTGLLLGEAVMDVARARGAGRYDLGEGPRAYKRRWAHLEHHTQDLTIKRRSWRVLARDALGYGVAELRELRRAVQRRMGGPPAGAAAAPADGGDGEGEA